MAAADRIRQLNDALRTTFEGGRIVMTHSVDALSPEVVAAALLALRSFDDFTPDNDPHGEHDFGGFEAAGRRFLFKIDYYDLDLRAGSEEPADPEKTLRVLTLMLPEDY